MAADGRPRLKRASANAEALRLPWSRASARPAAWSGRRRLHSRVDAAGAADTPGPGATLGGSPTRTWPSPQLELIAGAVGPSADHSSRTQPCWVGVWTRRTISQQRREARATGPIALRRPRPTRRLPSRRVDGSLSRIPAVAPSPTPPVATSLRPDAGHRGGRPLRSAPRLAPTPLPGPLPASGATRAHRRPELRAPSGSAPHASGSASRATDSAHPVRRLSEQKDSQRSKARTRPVPREPQSNAQRPRGRRPGARRPRGTARGAPRSARRLGRRFRGSRTSLRHST